MAHLVPITIPNLIPTTHQSHPYPHPHLILTPSPSQSPNHPNKILNPQPNPISSPNTSLNFSFHPHHQQILNSSTFPSEIQTTPITIPNLVTNLNTQLNPCLTILNAAFKLNPTQPNPTAYELSLKVNPNPSPIPSFSLSQFPSTITTHPYNL